jgi:hypothetical protein
MTSSHPAEIDLVAAVRRRQKTSLAMTALVTAVLIAAIGGFLLYSLAKLESLQGQVGEKSAELAKVTARLQTTQQQLANVQQDLAKAEQVTAEASNYVKHLHQLDWSNEKLIATEFGRASRLLLIIAELQQRNVHWGSQNTPDGGFTSPGFASFVLQRATGVPTTFEALPLRTGEPHPGDIIRYNPPYTMFYFRDVQPNRPAGFVVGMTPFGIVSLDKDFGPEIVEVRITPLSE